MQKNTNIVCDDKLRKYHHKICDIIKEHGNKTPKRHGNDWVFEMSNRWTFYLDDYSYALTLVIPPSFSREIRLYLGIDFGGFEPNINIQSYRYILGTIAKCFWRSKRPIKYKDYKNE